jgi:hypothetical protein
MKPPTIYLLSRRQLVLVGNEHEAVVEFAPYQKVVLPKENRRRDPKLNTLDQDPDYLRFLELLAAGPEVGLVNKLVSS